MWGFFHKKLSFGNTKTKSDERMIFTGNRKFSEKQKEQFRKYADSHAPKRNLALDLIFSFTVGGLICTAGQGFFELYSSYLDENTSKTLVSVTLIFLSCLFTGIGCYDTLASHAGAGTLVPITGFANAVCSPAIDARAEGFIFGIGANMFKIAGPVIVYGIAASVVYGCIYWVTTVT